MLKKTKNSDKPNQACEHNTHPLRKSECLHFDHKYLQVYEDIESGFYSDFKFGIWSLLNRNEYVAVKSFKKATIKGHREELLKEISTMSSLQHNHIIKLHGMCFGKDKSVKMVIEYTKFGSLINVMRNPEQRKCFCQHIRLKDFASQICNGMSYLASKGLVHSGLAARNVLVVEENLIRISDFGIARALGQKKSNAADRAPATVWCAPEVIQHQRYTTKSDVYSYGVVLWEMMTFGEEPFKEKLAYLISNPNECTRGCPKKMNDIMRACWSENPEKRPGFEEIASSLYKIDYQVGSAKCSNMERGRGLLFFDIRSKITLIERKNDTEWLAQNKDAEVGIIQENMVSLNIKPQEREIPSVGYEEKANGVLENERAPPVPPRPDLERSKTLPRERPVPKPRNPERRPRSSTEPSKTNNLDTIPPVPVPRKNCYDSAFFRPDDARSSTKPPPMSTENGSSLFERQSNPAKATLSRDWVTVAGNKTGFSTSQGQLENNAQNREAYPLVDLSENCPRILELPAAQPMKLTTAGNTPSNGSELSEPIYEYIWPDVDVTTQNQNTYPSLTNAQSFKGQRAERHPFICEQVIKPPTQIINGPETLRRLPTATHFENAYGKETDTMIDQLQREFKDLSRDDCYARLLHYNGDVEMIRKILKIKEIARIDEEYAQLHLRHCNWDVDRTLNYIFSKSEAPQ